MDISISGQFSSLAGGSFITLAAGDYTLSASNSGSTYTNTGAISQPAVTLPVAPPLGTNFAFVANNAGAFNFVINAGTGQVIKLGNTASSSGGAAYWTGVAGAAIYMVYIAAGVWQITNSTGTAVTLA